MSRRKFPCTIHLVRLDDENFTLCGQLLEPLVNPGAPLGIPDRNLQIVTCKACAKAPALPHPPGIPTTIRSMSRLVVEPFPKHGAADERITLCGLLTADLEHFEVAESVPDVTCIICSDLLTRSFR